MKGKKLLSAHDARGQDQASRSAHLRHVIFKCRAATEADLVILAISPGMRLREAMGAEPLQKLLEECRHDWPRYRADRVFSAR